MHPYGVIGVGELPKKFRHVDDEDEATRQQPARRAGRARGDQRWAAGNGRAGDAAGRRPGPQGLPGQPRAGPDPAGPRRCRRSGRAGRRTPAHPPHHAGGEDAQVRHEPARRRPVG
ncbi:hypothetical protein P4124_00775 [Pseudomonas aeruginosa]|nr:hypothetical protein [Pseudomonas aeruginosa]